MGKDIGAAPLFKKPLKRISRKYELVAGLVIEFEEPTLGEVYAERDNIALLSKTLRVVGSTNMAEMPHEERRKIIEKKSGPMTTAFLKKMDEFLGEEVKIEKQPLTHEDIVKSVFETNTVKRKFTFTHDGRVINVVVKLPVTEKSNTIRPDDAITSMAVYIDSVDDATPESLGEVAWVEFVKNLPYILLKNLAAEYNKLFDLTTALILDDKGLVKSIENF
jgi:hypothetical protein